MPAKTQTIKFPAWSEQIDDDCLYWIVREALVARYTAVRLGADSAGAPVRKALAAADKTLDAVANGTVVGSAACAKASVAIRKYTNVVDQLTAELVHGRAS